MASSPFNIVETSFRTASLVNSNAAEEAARGNAAEASLIFRQALEVMSHISGDVFGQASNSGAIPPARNVSTLPLEFSNDDEGFCVYNNLLTFERAAAPKNNMDFSFYSSAIVFNMGVIFHHHGVATGAVKFYQAADRMYEKCLNMLQYFPAFFDSDMDALLLAALNNRAHITFKLGTYDSTDQALSKIREISCMLLYSPESTVPQHLDESMINEILINSMVSGPGCAASA